MPLGFALALPALAQNAPAPAASAPSVVVVDCKTIDAEIARAEQARRAAQDDSDNAWKAIVPFAVLARKASARSALDDAQNKLGALKVQAASCERAPSSFI